MTKRRKKPEPGPEPGPETDELHESWQALGRPALKAGATGKPPNPAQIDQRIARITEALRAMSTLGPDDGRQCSLSIVLQTPGAPTWSSYQSIDLENAISELETHLATQVHYCLEEARRHQVNTQHELSRFTRQVKALSHAHNLLPLPPEPEPRPEPVFLGEPPDDEEDNLPF